ncbi:winged helix-turn-helix domain-containing protein [Falsarthrobacter nasiphocae]|uniref:ArsR family transcriptional regulator n=1 Tax=Falsarthrobacter nasiphocae TaxID=189863 RepID=A0AAE3YDQ6_9MICC|nr:winged helix-turn-helix domain-containing protein [Falsarthrobacter nasiphocae]MDR6891494.1 putative ArsR family transcriptional regulator [Falsarthrobacter nasiphocae]
MTDPTLDADFQSRARALSSPVRFRILRACLHESRTNKEIAEILDMNPATTLHHVRTLVASGFLEAEEARTGKRGAREIPYRSTGATWGKHVPHVSNVLIETFVQEVEPLSHEEMDVWRLGVKLNDAERQEMMSRVREVFEDYANREPSPDGTATSVFLAHYADRS